MTFKDDTLQDFNVFLNTTNTHKKQGFLCQENERYEICLISFERIQCAAKKKHPCSVRALPPC